MLLLEQREEFQRSWGEGREVGGRRGHVGGRVAEPVTSGIVMLRDCHRIHCTRDGLLGKAGGRRVCSVAPILSVKGLVPGAPSVLQVVGRPCRERPGEGCPGGRGWSLQGWGGNVALGAEREAVRSRAGPGPRCLPHLPGVLWNPLDLHISRSSRDCIFLRPSLSLAAGLCDLRQVSSFPALFHLLKGCYKDQVSQ